MYVNTLKWQGQCHGTESDFSLCSCILGLIIFNVYFCQVVKNSLIKKILSERVVGVFHIIKDTDLVCLICHHSDQSGVDPGFFEGGPKYRRGSLKQGIWG